jgi:hypothetical protein
MNVLHWWRTQIYCHLTNFLWERDMAQDRLFFKGSSFLLIDQRVLENGFWKMNKRPLIDATRKLAVNDYSTDWVIQENKLFLAGIYLDENGTDLLQRILPGAQDKTLADWFCGDLYATNVKSIQQLKNSKRPTSGLRVKEVYFLVENGSVKFEVRRKLPR